MSVVDAIQLMLSFGMFLIAMLTLIVLLINNDKK